MHSIKPVFLCLYLFVCIAFFSCHSKKINSDPPKSPPPLVDVLIAEPQIISDIIEANGSVVANEYVELHPEVAGRLIYLNVPEGKFIQKGTVIARINDEDLRANLYKSEAALKLAQDYVNRLQQLLAVNGVNQADYDAAVNAVVSNKADIQYTQALIDKTVIHAPFSGVVGLRQVSIGAFVNITDVIATIQQVGDLKIDFTVPEEYSNYVKPGGVVKISLDANTDTLQHPAKIIAVEPQANTNTRNLVVRAILQDDAKDNPGAFVKVFIPQQQSRPGIMVPTNCILPNDISKQIILVKNGKAQFTDVTTGVRKASNAEITSGLKPGDSVIVTGVLFARDKQPVKVRSVKPLESFDTQQ